MSYPFWVNDFDRVKDHRIEYPAVSKIFEYPVSFWYGERSGAKTMDNLTDRLTRLMERADPYLPVLVLYNLPGRDIGQYSKGGSKTIDSYLDFVERFADGVGDKTPITVYEPDGLPHMTQLSRREAIVRMSLIKDALDILTTRSQCQVYVDVGHSNWLEAERAGALLNRVVNDKVKGFSVNVSNFRSTEESAVWASDVQSKCMHPLGYVIDTSRNGNGPYGNQWCNPPGRALGHPPTTDTGIPGCDAFLWVKIPGESDGKRNGGPQAGRFWPEYATQLVENSSLVK